MARTLFDDEDFTDQLVGLLTQDIESLHNLHALLEVDDFKPLRGMQWGQQRWVVADRALQYYERFHQPLGKLLHADIIDYANGLQLNERQIQLLEEYLTRLSKIKLNGAAAIAEKVTKFKLERIKAATIQEMADLQASGQLTDEKWMELCRKAINTKDGQAPLTNYFEGLEARIDYRSLRDRFNTNPMLLMEPLDNILFPGLARKQLGLVIAPTTRGKTSFLRWLGMVYPLQRCNTLYITLEDAKEDVESSLDAMISGVPFLQLAEQHDTLRDRFQSYKRLIGSNLTIVDGSHEKYNVAKVEQQILRLRDAGVIIDTLIIDYDKYLRADGTIRSNSQVEIMDQVYQDLRRLLSRYNLYGWIAAQTQRNTKGLKILSGDRVAESIEKERQSVICISMGKGDLPGDSIYMWVDKNRFGKKEQGCHIIPKFESSLIYDHHATRKALDAMKAQEYQNEEYPSE